MPLSESSSCDQMIMMLTAMHGLRVFWGPTCAAFLLAATHGTRCACCIPHAFTISGPLPAVVRVSGDAA